MAVSWPLEFRTSDLLVVDLRRELERRGLDKTGLKQVLVDRLRQAMAMDGVNTDTIAIDEHEDSDHCTDDLASCPKESQGSDEKPELEEEHLSGMAIAKELSRTAAIAGLQGPPMTTDSTSSEEEVLRTPTEMTSPPGEEASVIDVLALRTCVSDLLQPLVQKVDTLSRCVERERKEAREREEQLSSKIMELESAVTLQTKVIEKEKEEAKDREHRLCMKVRDLEKSLSSLSASVEDSFAKIEKKEHTILQQLKSRGKSETTRCTTHCTANSEAEPREQQQDRVNSNKKTTTAPAPKTSSEQLNQVSPEAAQKKTQNGTPAGSATAEPGALRSTPQHTAPEKDQPTETSEPTNEHRQRTPPRPEKTYLDAAKKNRSTAPTHAFSRSTDPTKNTVQSTTNKPLGKLVGAPRIR